MKGKIIYAGIIICILFFSNCQNVSQKGEKPKEETVKEKIMSFLGSEEEKEEKKTSPQIFEIPEINIPERRYERETSERTKTGKEEITFSEELSPIPEGLKFVEPSEIGKEIEKIFRTIYFEYDSYEIKKENIEILKKIGDYLLENTTVVVLIEGHCDERGTREYNLVLGEQRALSVRNFLINLGVSPKRLFTVSYGEDRPVDPAHNEQAWAKNRRCEFKIGVKK
jgi:peptidoglycan-associated lipoprotein